MIGSGLLVPVRYRLHFGKLVIIVMYKGYSPWESHGDRDETFASEVSSEASNEASWAYLYLEMTQSIYIL